MFDFIRNLFGMGAKDKNNQQETPENEAGMLRKALGHKENELHERDEVIATMKMEYKTLREAGDALIQNAVEEERVRIYRSVSQLLINYPTAQKRVALNPELKAKDLMGMLKPLEKMMETLELQAIGNPDETVPYNPVVHAAAQAGADYEERTTVVIKLRGYKMKDVLLDKAKVQKVE